MGKKARLENRARRKAAEKVERDRVRIVIGTAPSGVSLQREIALIKPALIYGDQVVLCSLTATLLEQCFAFSKLRDDEQMLAIGEIIRSSGLVSPDASDALALVAAWPQLKKSLSAEQVREFNESDALAELEASAQHLSEHGRNLAEVMYGQFREAGGEELVPALDAGALQIESLIGADADVDTMIEALVERMTGALLDRRSYVICDEAVGSIVGATSDVPDPSGPAVRRARRVAAGTGLIAELPSFPKASIQEALDIRRELDPAVLRFRSAMASVEAELAGSDPLTAGFAEDVRLLCEAKVAPELLELEQRVHDNSALRQLQNAVLSDPKAAAKSVGTGLCVLLGTGNDILGAVSAAAGIAVAAENARRVEKKNIERHRFYLLHATEKRLRKTA